MAAARFEVFGLVQGVGFRSFVQRQAQALELRGWVRNRADASVEVCVEGSPQALDEMEEQLHVGPAGSAVSRVLRDRWPLWPQQAERLEDFKILE